jgi:hypothetical protein
MKKICLLLLSTFSLESYATISSNQIDIIRSEYQSTLKQVKLVSREDTTSNDIKTYLNKIDQRLTKQFISFEKSPSEVKLIELEKNFGLTLNRSASNRWAPVFSDKIESFYFWSNEEKESFKDLVSSSRETLYSLFSRTRDFDSFTVDIHQYFQNEEAILSKTNALVPIINDFEEVTKSEAIRNEFNEKYGIKFIYDSTKNVYSLSSEELLAASGFSDIESMDKETKDKYKTYLQEYVDAFYDLDTTYLPTLTDGEYLFIVNILE